MSDSQENRDKTEFLVKLFDEGRQFTEDILKENERLRRAVAGSKIEIRQKGAEEKASLSGSEGLIQRLEAEKNLYKEKLEELQKNLVEVEKENQEFAQKYIEVEQQNTNLVNLYVAGYRLHSTLDFNEVVAIINEIIINLVGSEMFGVYMVDEETNSLQLIASEGLEERQIASITIGVGEVGQVVEKGEIYYGGDQEKGKNPIVCIPLKIQDQVLGIIAIFGLLQQKDGLEEVDIELFSLMADHAATAIYCAKLHTMSERKLKTMKSLLELLKK